METIYFLLFAPAVPLREKKNVSLFAPAVPLKKKIVQRPSPDFLYMFLQSNHTINQTNMIKATYLVQTKDLVQTRANLLKKVSKNSKKIMNVLLRLHNLYIKFHGQIRLTLEVKKRQI